MIPTSSLVMIVINLVLGFAIPIYLAWWLVKKHNASWRTILIGAATFIVFALVLESLVHNIVLKGPHGAAIQNNTLYFAVYGGLMAGLFEETGRFLSMKYLLKKEPTTVKPALAYGIGHGGVEMILLFGFAMVSYLVMAVMIKAGQTDTLFSQVPAEAQGQIQAMISELTRANVGDWLSSLWERFSALLLHLSLSVLVWAAVRKGGKWLWLFPAAILLHALVDGIAVVLMRSTGTLVLETIIFAMAIAIASLAYMVARRISS
jgi:uncharacterized membrane protein YhfC